MYTHQIDAHWSETLSTPLTKDELQRIVNEEWQQGQIVNNERGKKVAIFTSERRLLAVRLLSLGAYSA